MMSAYRTNEGKPWVLPVVREAESKLAADESQNHEYLPILGFAPFAKAAAELVLGAGATALKVSAHPARSRGGEGRRVQENRVLAVQCLSGTGSLRVAIDFLASVGGYKAGLVSDPTWGNHNLIFKTAGTRLL